MISLNEFATKVQSEDLARSNLFSVEFREGIGGDLFGPSTDRRNDGSVLEKISKATGISPDSILNVGQTLGQMAASYSSAIRGVTGYFSPGLMEAVGLGDWMDGFLKYPYNFNLLVKSTNIPAVTLSYNQIHTDRKMYHFAESYTHPEISMTFFNSIDHFERRQLMKWANRIINPETGNYGFYDDVWSNLTIHTYDRRGYKRTTYEFKEIFPVSIGDVSQSFDNTTEVSTFDVSFVYKSFVAYGVEEELSIIDRARTVAKYGKRIILGGTRTPLDPLTNIRITKD